MRMLNISDIVDCVTSDERGEMMESEERVDNRTKHRFLLILRDLGIITFSEWASVKMMRWEK